MKAGFKRGFGLSVHAKGLLITCHCEGHSPVAIQTAHGFFPATPSACGHNDD
jgi:hypothetical protein